MIFFMLGFGKVSATQEREFERENVSAKREGYLKSNPMVRFETDPAYAEKISQLEVGLRKGGLSNEAPGLVLDLGGNTGGESTILHQRGFEIILSDINEVALDIATERAKKFGLQVPRCVAADVHALPFEDDTFEAVMVIEALHHFEDYEQALSEILRVLRPGGFLMSLEPIGWNPLRRLSEIRDRFRGTIEKSFTQRQLKKLLGGAGFSEIEILAVPSGRSNLRMGDVPVYRRWAAKLHAHLQRNHPRWFGNYQIWGQKSGTSSSKVPEWPHFLTLPGGGELVHFADNRWYPKRSKNFAYPQLNQVPVLIEADRVERT